ncbi:2-hydroxy-3-keto-5-methylthiopentenyl-1-phosphate phosphatase [Bacillota bacterium]
MYDKILFLDFDGTITSEETLVGSMRLTIDEDLYEEKLREMMEGKLTLSQALHMAFGTVPSERLPDIIEYVKSVPIRPGFEELLLAMADKNIPVVVISGGLRPCIEAKLEPFRERLLDVHSVDVDSGGPHLKLISAYEEKGDLLQKTRVMEQYEYKTAICAGDGHTDMRMAKTSQLVFARDQLADALKKQGVPYEPWQDFFDIRDFILKIPGGR